MQGKKGHYATNYAISAEFHLEYYHFIHINVKNIRNSAWCLQSLLFCPDNALIIFNLILPTNHKSRELPRVAQQQVFFKFLHKQRAKKFVSDSPSYWILLLG